MAERKRFIVLQRVKSWDEVQGLKNSATENDVVIWRALRAHAGKVVEMGMMVRHILAKVTEDTPKVKILRQWVPAHSGSSGGRSIVHVTLCMRIRCVVMVNNPLTN